MLPPTTEPERKKNQAHFPYWLRFQTNSSSYEETKSSTRKNFTWLYLGFVVLFFVAIGFILSRHYVTSSPAFIERFERIDEASLANHGWMLQAKDEPWWRRRTAMSPGLTLYTLPGDNWPDPQQPLGIKNLLLKKIEGNCFSAELHLRQFMPLMNWQQAGLLLMEDSSLTSRCLRLSIAYNDDFGGYPGQKEIIIQGVSTGGEQQDKPEEIAHLRVFDFQQDTDSLVKKNLQHTALRIEKKGDQFRFLYSASHLPNGPLKEAFAKQLSIRPKYIGIFALKGFLENTPIVPAQVSFFSLAPESCEN